MSFIFHSENIFKARMHYLTHLRVDEIQLNDWKKKYFKVIITFFTTPETELTTGKSKDRWILKNFMKQDIFFNFMLSRSTVERFLFFFIIGRNDDEE